MIKNKWKLVSSIGLPIMGGGIVGMLTVKSSKKKYQYLEKPTYAPPMWIFPIAWTTIYASIGTARYLFNKDPKVKAFTTGNRLYNLQLGINYLWPLLFFRWDKRALAFMDTILLCPTVMANAYYFYRRNKFSGLLMLPYVGWSTYAMVLNFSMWRKNADL